MKRKAVYQIVENAETRTADINIYGDITSAAELYRNWGCSEGEVSARDVKQAIEGLDVDTINVYINSYGGEVAEALAIYSSLKRHSAQIHTFCDGFACSAATIVFCAGDVRTMGAIALLMIHNCMSYLGYANSEEMRKAAEDNDKINQSSIEAYKSVCNLTEDETKEKMNAETWMTAQEAMNYGFVDELANDVKIENSISNGMVVVNNMTCNLQHFHNPRQLEEIINRHGKDDKNMNESKLMSLLQDIKDAVTGKNKNSNTETDPVAVERQRMLDLDNLRDGNELINKIVEIAKKNGNTAEEIKEYVAAAKAEAEKPAKDKGLEEIKNLIKDQLASGSNGVAPQNSDGVPQDNKALEIDNLVKAMQKVRGE
mgnify:CR=1 FL=1